MENKYYTPSIEEFHIGFEYQYLASNPAEFFHTKLENWHEFIGSDGEFYLPEDIKRGSIRVKYLDSEDLKELGYERRHDMSGYIEILYLLFERTFLYRF